MGQNEKKTLRQRKRQTSEKSTEPEAIDESKTEKDKEQKKPKRESKLSGYRIWTRMIIIAGVLIIGYFTSSRVKDKKFALRRETIIFRSQDRECSTEYLKELRNFQQCLPVKCGRFVSDSIVTDQEADLLLALAKRGLTFGGSNGGASILDLNSGALSQGDVFVNIYKLPEAKGFLEQSAAEAFRMIRAKIMNAISDKYKVDTSKIFLTQPTFFSRITNETAKNIHDEYWHSHVDRETYEAFHYTSLVYLNDYQRDFQGGRFLFIDEETEANRTTHSYVEPKKHRVIVFTSGEENLHQIEKVTSGVRYALTISFTCNKTYAINDPESY